MQIHKCETCGQIIKAPKPDLKIGQNLYAFIKDRGGMHTYEVLEGTNKKSLLIKCFDTDGSTWTSTGFGYRDIGVFLFLTKEEALLNPLK